jgi:integrase
LLAFARARGWRDATENPARWRDHLSLALPKPAAIHREKHQASVPFEKLPAVMGRLASNAGTAALCARFVALTGCRATAGAHARWDEIDLNAKVWTIPLERTKAGPALRVPLSKQALAVLNAAAKKRTSSGLVFAGQRDGKPLSLTSLSKALRRAGGGDATTHGLRSSFKSWTIERELSRELAEMALGHVVGNDVERAYQRGDALEPRRKLMQTWGDYLGGAKGTRKRRG